MEYELDYLVDDPTATSNGGGGGEVPSTPETTYSVDDKSVDGRLRSVASLEKVDGEALTSALPPSTNISLIADNVNVFGFVPLNEDGSLAQAGSGQPTRQGRRDMYFMEEMQRYDGWYNNLAHPNWGTTGKFRFRSGTFSTSVSFLLTESHLTRKAPPSYSDGVYMMAGEDRPSPRLLSQALMRGEDGHGSARNLTVLFALFGRLPMEQPEDGATGES